MIIQRKYICDKTTNLLFYGTFICNIFYQPKILYPIFTKIILLYYHNVVINEIDYTCLHL